MSATAETLDALRRGDLSGTRELHLSGLDDFPGEILGLAESLEVLDIGGGTLTTLPVDLSRLTKLRVLFVSGNRFERLPPVLGDCLALSQIGARGCGIVEVPGESLPPRLRWLTLTDNRIESLPDALGRRRDLQKLLLAGNRLRSLPDGLESAGNLELIRLAANRFEALPDWLPALPSLAWVSFAGNPCEPAVPASAASLLPFADLALHELLGEGASGRVHRATWRQGGGSDRAVALKLFKGAMTSDGLPDREMTTCLAAGEHANLTGALGRLTGHPDGLDGLAMRLLPEHWRPLAAPPSLASCSRDVYAPALRLAPDTALRITRGVASATAHLHARGLLHGDLYAHNTLWDGTEGRAVLSDFGAASVLPQDTAWQRVEVRAFGILLGEVLDRCEAPDALASLRRLLDACRKPDVARRPLMDEVVAALGREA